MVEKIWFWPCFTLLLLWVCSDYCLVLLPHRLIVLLWPGHQSDINGTLLGLPWSRWVMVSWVTLRYCNCVKTEQYPYSDLSRGGDCSRPLPPWQSTCSLRCTRSYGKVNHVTQPPPTLSFAISAQIFLAHKCLRKLRPCQWCHCVLAIWRQFAFNFIK